MKDFNGYINKLNNALKEKLFFINKIELYKYDLIVDFGCATGTLLNEISLVNKVAHTKLLGYDNNENMIKEGSRLHPHINFTNEWSNVYKAVNNANRPLVIFSSVLHEIGESNGAWNDAEWLMKNCHTIIIRDMKRPLNNEPIDNPTRKRILKQVAPWQASLFESKWGTIRDKETMYRFFLMNEFVDNFESEVEEDYFSVPWAEISWLLEDTHSVFYERSYILPYRKEQVKKRFNHVMNDITHKEMIFIRKTKI